MTGKNFRIALCVLLAALAVPAAAAAQPLVCKPAALAARRPLPELNYDCADDLDESDAAVLGENKRREAIDVFTKSLEKLVAADWWQTAVEDLNRCDFRRRAGRFSADEKQQYENGNYYFQLRGDNRFRVVVAKDPCYQTGFNGANIFLLNRAGGRVFAAEIIDGFYTRADFPLGYDRAANGRETIIEIGTTSGGLNPTETNYYFTIDPRTKRAVPKNLFRQDGRPTNRIYSQMILGEPEQYGLPPKSEALQIIGNRRLAPRFYIFEDSGEEFGNGNNKFKRVVFKWNGKFYERLKQ